MFGAEGTGEEYISSILFYEETRRRWFGPLAPFLSLGLTRGTPRQTPAGPSWPGNSGGGPGGGANERAAAEGEARWMARGRSRATHAPVGCAAPINYKYAFIMQYSTTPYIVQLYMCIPGYTKVPFV